MNSNVSFKSRINILRSANYYALHKGDYVDFLLEKTPNIVKSKDLYTNDIRTCTAGVFVTEESAVGFHFWDTKLFDKRLLSYIEKLNKTLSQAKNGIIIGAKNLDDAPHSIKNFNIIKKETKYLTPNISIFKGIKKEYGEVSFNYTKENDTLNMLIKSYSPNGYTSVVTNIKKLLQFFSTIKIAPTDTLFIDGIEITEKDAPKIFK